MKRLKGGSFSATVSLKAGHGYRFRYVLDGNTWVNDHDADSYIADEHGNDDSIVTV